MRSEEHLDKLMAIEPSPRYVIGDDPIRQEEKNDEHRISKNIKTIANFVRTIVNSDRNLFALRSKLRGPEPIHIHYEGRRLINAVSSRLREFEEYFPGNAINPYIELLRSAVRSDPSLMYADLDLKSAKGEGARELYAKLVNLVKSLRKAGRTEAFKKELDARRRQCQKNQKSAEDYIDAIFKYRASKNLAIRIDLACGCETLERRGIMNTVDVNQAKEELDRFIRYVRENYPLTGWMATLEYGLLTGLHFHVLIFIDGHQQFVGAALGYLFGEHWKNKITEGRGRYYNCNAAWYRENGVGMIWHHDSAKREILMSRVVSYLTKSDFWIKFQGMRKTFFKGQMPSEAEMEAKESAVGRPRKQLNADGGLEVDLAAYERGASRRAVVRSRRQKAPPKRGMLR